MNEAKSVFPRVKEVILEAKLLMENLAGDRIEKLESIKAYIQSSIAENKVPKLVFICTHNSRRSHFGQIWAKVMAENYGIAPLETYSGGTEATAFNPNAIQALRSQGFEINTKDENSNPHYTIRYGTDIETIAAWSKKYNDSANPSADFCAIMTCTEADEACPIVFGASHRVALPYQDPKKSDGTASQNATYRERSLQIASEMIYLFS